MSGLYTFKKRKVKPIKACYERIYKFIWGDKTKGAQFNARWGKAKKI